MTKTNLVICQTNLQCLQYTSTICDHLFTLYRHVQHRPFVLQFLPSFIIAYYDVLYHHHHHHRRHPESVDVKTKVKRRRTNKTRSREREREIKLFWYLLIIIISSFLLMTSSHIYILFFLWREIEREQEAFYTNWEKRYIHRMCASACQRSFQQTTKVLKTIFFFFFFVPFSISSLHLKQISASSTDLRWSFRSLNLIKKNVDAVALLAVSIEKKIKNMKIYRAMIIV